MNLEVITRKPESGARSTEILFVHGMFHGAWCWDEHFLPYFAEKGYAVHALSLRGHAGSDGRERLRWYSLADYVSDLGRVIRQLPTSPVLVGHSMGGMIVQKHLQTQQAPAAVLLGSVSPKGLLPVTLQTLRRHPAVFMKANLTLSMYPIVGTPERYRELFFVTDIPEEKMASCFARLQDESFRAFTEMLLLRMFPPNPVTETPLLVLGGADDAAISPDEVEATARLHKTRAELYPDMGHAMMLEAGWQAVADRIISWLGEHGLD